MRGRIGLPLPVALLKRQESWSYQTVPGNYLYLQPTCTSDDALCNMGNQADIEIALIEENRCLNTESLPSARDFYVEITDRQSKLCDSKVFVVSLWVSYWQKSQVYGVIA